MSLIFESKTLANALEIRVDQYKDLKEQLTDLKKEFNGIVNLDDEFQGQGAAAIKGFYKAQVDVINAWMGLIDRHIALFSSIPGDIIEADLNESIVTVPFLEEELVTANHNAKEMVRAQKMDLKKILEGIHDIIQLEPFSDEGFLENMEKAEKGRTKTINKVHKLDHKWTTEYAESEEDLDCIVSLMQQLKESSTRGGETSPLYFNSSSYKNSEVFKNVEVRKKENEEYLKVKKEEAEKRLMKDLKAQLDSVTDPDEFLKIANKIGYENLEPIQQQYALQLEANRQTKEIAKGVGVGLYDAGKDFVVGTWDFVTNPGESLKGTANSIVHPVQTYKYISKSIEDSYERDMVNGDAYSRSHWVSYSLGTTATSIVGTKGAGAVTKTGIATTKTAAVKGAAKAKELSGSIANLLPYNPRNQLELAGGIPYNTVNSAGLKEQLISMARVESEINGKGTGKEYKNYKAVEYTGATKVNGEERDISRRVFQRIDIDYKRIDPESSMTNFQLMKKGRAPIWKDGTVIELHHLIQREPGSMVEIPASMHDEYNKILHGLVENGGSFRNDPVLKKQYDNFRSKYWRWRAKQIDKSDL